jgi:hypothetical protein
MTNRICNLPDCNRPLSRFGLCNMHAHRQRAGKPLEQPPKIQRESCTVDGCDKKPKSKYAALCSAHYFAVYRYGSVKPEHEPRFENIAGRRYGALMVLSRTADGDWNTQCDCGETRVFRYYNLRVGDAVTCGNRTVHYRTSMSYGAIHDRLRADRGPASNYPCADCGGRAAHWSYDHTDPDEYRDWSTPCALWLSTDQSCYQARCARCHKKLDIPMAEARALMYR